MPDTAVAAATRSLFAAVELAPRDPIMGLTEGFLQDTRATKVNLGVGVYLTNEGKIPVLRAVTEAERRLAAKTLPRGYLPIDGIAAYDKAVQDLLFGKDSPLLAAGKVLTAQALGGTGGLRIGAELMRKVQPDAVVAISSPSWENHRAVFEYAGFKVVTYPYYDAASHGVDFAAMTAALEGLAPGSIAVLHACCHNPTGVDLSPAQWRTVVDIARDRQLVPFLDIAYQGFASGIEADGAVVRLFADSGLTFLVASSFSKNFSLYGERVGALSIVDQSSDESARVLSQLKRVIRAQYSTPPTHGGMIVSTVLGDAELRRDWEAEVGEMRDRIKAMRTALTDALARRCPGRDFSFIVRQNGMFSFSGLSADQVQRLRDEAGIYALASGRICVAALNTGNVDYVAEAIARVV